MLAGNPVNSWFSAGSQISLTLGKVLDLFDFLTICSFLIDNDSKWSGPVDNYQMTWVVPFFFSSEYSTMHMPSLLMKCADTTYKHTCENQMRELAAPWSHSTNKVLLYCLRTYIFFYVRDTSYILILTTASLTLTNCKLLLEATNTLWVVLSASLSLRLYVLMKLY